MERTIIWPTVLHVTPGRRFTQVAAVDCSIDKNTQLGNVPLWYH